MMRTVFTQDGTITYRLERKKVKNINMRILADGSIRVSIPVRLSDKNADDFVRSKSEWIFKRINASCNRMKKFFDIKNGGYIHILGQDRILTIIPNEYLMHGLEEDNFFIFSPFYNDAERVKKAIGNILEEIIKERITNACRIIYNNYFKDYGIPFPEIKIRKMKSRWGSCHVDKNTLVFNKALVFVPENCIEYVVCHEFVHFLHPDHSKRFYLDLDIVYPSWKEAKKTLNLYNFACENVI